MIRKLTFGWPLKKRTIVLNDMGFSLLKVFYEIMFFAGITIGLFLAVIYRGIIGRWPSFVEFK